MLIKLGAYAIAFVVLIGIELPFFPITLNLSRALRKSRWIALFVISLFDAIKICCGVLLAGWFISRIDQSPSWLMFLIPGYFMIHNSLLRINHVKNGHSNVKRILEQRGELELYNQRHDLWNERGHLLGDAVGWIVGTNMILQSACLL